MKKGYTIEQHRQAGAKLKAARRMLVTLTCDLNKYYPVSSKAVKLADKAERTVNSLRSELDTLLFRENPQIDFHDAVSIYYHGQGVTGE